MPKLLQHPKKGRRSMNALLRYLGDGMLDLFLGLLLIDASVALVDGSDGSDGSAGSSGLGFAVIYLLLLAAKGEVTRPRLGAEELARASHRPPDRRPATGRWALVALLVLLIGAAAVMWFHPSGPAAQGRASEGPWWSLVALAGLAGIGIAGYRRAAPRFIAYAAAVAAAIVAGSWLGAGPGAGPMALLVLGVGVVVTAIGAALLGRFLRQHPRSPATAGGPPHGGR